MTDTKPVSDERLAQLLDSATRLEIDEYVSVYTELQNYRASRHQEPVNESAEVEREAAIGAAYDFIKPKLLELNREKGPVGVWSTGYRSGWEAALRAASMPKIEPSPSTSEEDADYLVWSNEHRAWWRENSCGYARSILEAGRYTRAEAVDIADKSRNGWKLDQRPDEIAVAIADLPPPIRAALMSPKETCQ